MEIFIQVTETVNCIKASRGHLGILFRLVMIIYNQYFNFSSLSSKMTENEKLYHFCNLIAQNCFRLISLR